MGFREDSEALRARVAELEAEVAARDQELVAVRKQGPDVRALRAEIARLQQKERRTRWLWVFAIFAFGIPLFTLVSLGVGIRPLVLAAVRGDYSQAAFVVRASGEPPGGLSTGPCALFLDTSRTDCRADVRCGDVTLFEDDLVDCTLRDGALETLHDDRDAVVDGDPCITMLDDHRVRIGDEGWSIDLELRGPLYD